MTAMRLRAAKLALLVAGAFACAGGAAFALAPGSGRPSSPIPDLFAALVPAPTSLTLLVTPRTRTVGRGATATFAMRIRRRDRSAVRLRVLRGLPRGATATFELPSVRGTRAKLRIDTNGAASGAWHLELVARTGRGRARAWATIVIRAPKPAVAAPVQPAVPAPVPPADPIRLQPEDFTIAGSLPSALTPGIPVALRLALTNPGSAELEISSLEVRVAGVSAPRASATHPCSLDDFEVTQYSGAYGFTLSPGATTTLADLGVPDDHWPRVALRDRPVNQNGCKGASLQLALSGTAGAR